MGSMWQHPNQIPWELWDVSAIDAVKNCIFVLLYVPCCGYARDKLYQLCVLACKLCFHGCPIRTEDTGELWLCGFMCGSMLFVFCLSQAFSCPVDSVIFAAFF